MAGCSIKFLEEAKGRRTTKIPDFKSLHRIPKAQTKGGTQMEENIVMVPGSGTKVIVRDVKKEIETAFLITPCRSSSPARCPTCATA